MTTLPTTSWLIRFRETREQHGRWPAWQLVIDRLGKKLLGASVTNVVRLEARNVDENLKADAEFSFRFLTPDEVRTFAADPRNDLDATFVARATAGHDLCYAATCGDRLAAYGWYALGSIEAEHGGGQAMSFPANMAYMYKGFTHPDFRGKRLHGVAMGLALKELAARGVDQLISTVDWTNWPSLKSCYRLGYTDLGRIVCLGPRCCPLTFATRVPTRLGVKFGRRADLSGRR